MSVEDKGDTRPRVLGWTVDQWALVAGQLPGPRAPTLDGALELRKRWILHPDPIELSKRDDDYAEALFRAVKRSEPLPLRSHPTASRN